jgi:hypothetical protein
MHSAAEIIERLTYLRFLLEARTAAKTGRVETEAGDFEKLGNVEGQATCIGCQKKTPKAGMFYSKSLDVYYHPQCLARDRDG